MKRSHLRLPVSRRTFALEAIADHLAAIAAQLDEVADLRSAAEDTAEELSRITDYLDQAADHVGDQLGRIADSLPEALLAAGRAARGAL